jgi:hypothetical protein
MSKMLRTAGMVVGAAALIATGVGAVAGAAAAAKIAGAIGVSSLAKLAATASVISAGLGAAGSLTAKPPTNERQGLQLSFKIDPGAPIPYAIGRTAVGGTVVYRETYGTDNHYQTYFVALSLGPIAGIDQRLIDRAAITFAGTSALGYYNRWMWQDVQLGALPEARALSHGIASPPFGSIPAQVPGWSAQHRMSGYAAASLTMLFDTKARRYQNGEPLPAWVLRGNLVWDPRLDSTYPGGSGPCRWNDPATHVYSETPALHGLKWRIGVFHNGKKVMGVGAPIDLIDVASIVEAANVQEANGWKVGGELNSEMDRWEALKLIEEAGGAEPIPSGARMATLQKMPRVPIGTIRAADIIEARSIPAMKPRRERINGYRARFRSEAHGWEMIPIDIVQVADYVTDDGGERTGSGDFGLVQNADQAGSLAAYKVFDSREIGPIELTLKPRFIGYRLGDCLSMEADETGLSGKLLIVRGRSIDPETGRVTMTFETETPEKHPAALGQTGAVPPVPTLTFAPDVAPAPSVSGWDASAFVWEDSGYSEPAIVVTGAADNSNAENVVFEIREVGGDWVDPSIDPPDATRRLFRRLRSKTNYEVAVSYKVRGTIGDRLVLGPIVTPEVRQPEAFTVGSHGNSAIVPGHYLHGLRKQDGTPIATDYRRSYTACYYSPDTGAWTSRSFDVFGGGAIDYGYGAGIGNGDATSGSDAGSMARYLNAIPAGLPVVVFTADEPAQLRHQGGLLEAMYRCGASARKFGGDGNAFPYRAAYILVGTAGAGEGNAAIERVQEPGVDGSPNAWLMTSFTIVNGVLQLSARDGSDGRDGTDGLPGADGADGQTSYIHYAYANSPDGQVDFTTGAPGNRAFEGVYADFVEADSGNPAAYTWREYKGPPFGMATRGTAIVAGNQVIKGEGGAADWDADAYSTVGFRGSAKMSCRFAAGSYAMAGLNTDPTADTSYTSIDFAWYYQPEQNVMYAFESGVNAASLGTYDPSANYAIEYDGVTVTYTANGVPKRQVYVGPDRTYYFDSSFLLATSRITDIEFKAGSQRPAGLTLVPATGATITGAASARIYGAPGGWGAGKASSLETFSGGAVAEWTVARLDSANVGAGLAQNPENDLGFNTITFALLTLDNGNTGAYVNGINVSGGPSVPLDQPVRCKVAYDGKRWVRWYVNGTEFYAYEWGEQPDPLKFSVALASLDPTVTDIAFSKAGTNGQDGANGQDGTNGADGADGTDGFIVDTETPVFVIPVYSSGAIKPGWSGGVGTIKLTKGGVVIAASSYSVANNQDVTGLALAGNQFSFTGLADDAGQFDVRAVYNGQTYSRTISVKKVYDGEAAYKESASTSGTISAGPLPITGATVVPSARGCTVSSTFSYVNSAPGSFVQWRGSLSIYWRNITDNGPWNLLETAIGSTASVVNVGTAQEPEYQYTNGSVSAAADFTAPVGDKEIGFEARLSRDVGSGSVNARGGVKLEVRS